MQVHFHRIQAKFEYKGHRVNVQVGRLKTRDWKTRHQTAGVENAGVAQYGKPKSPLFNIVTSVLQQPLELK